MLSGLIQQGYVNEAIQRCNTITINPDLEYDRLLHTPLLNVCMHFYTHGNKFSVEKWMELAEGLLKKGSDPNRIGVNAGSPLTVVVRRVQYSGLMMHLPGKLIKLLLQYGARINDDPHLLTRAVQGVWQDIEVVKILLQAGVCQTTKSGLKGDGYTPLQYVKRSREAGCYRDCPRLIAIQYMLEHGYRAYENKIDTEEKIRLAEQGKIRLAEQEKIRLAGEAEKNRLAELERNRLAGLEKIRLAEQEKIRLAGLEKIRVAEQEKIRVAEQEKIRSAEQEKIRLAGLEKNRSTEVPGTQFVAINNQSPDSKLENKTSDILHPDVELIKRLYMMMHCIDNLSNTVKSLQEKCDKYEQEKKMNS
jgi:hypothetical protein